ncbi:MAG: hypothetical protein QOD03_1635, partial [Verrucomicrobiota bacterium]|jgi:hypothetical protein
VEVRWDENENHHTVKIKLEGIVPQDCTIYFILKPDDGVDVKVINLHDTDANAHTTE